MANETIVGTLMLVPTYECIGVYGNFTGDDNLNNVAEMEYRAEGSIRWIRGMDMTPDTRPIVGNQQTNPYRYQWRASILGLQPDAPYQVRITFTDPDGVIGTNPVISTVRTRSDDFPSLGNIYHVDKDNPAASDTNSGTSEDTPFKTIAKAVSIANPGDTIFVHYATYYESITMNRGGVAGNYLCLRSYDDRKPVIDCLGLAWGIRVNQSYIRVRDFEIIGGNYSVEIGYRSASEHQPSNIVIEDNILRDGKAMSDPPGSYVPILARGQNQATSTKMENLTIQRNIMYLTQPPVATGEPTTGPGIWIYWANGGHVIRDNKIFFTGTVPTGRHGQDGIVNSSNFEVNYTWRDTDIYRNYIQGATDDGISLDGNCANIRVWNNVLTRCNCGISCCPILIGPAYIFRNVIYDPEVHWVGVKWIKGGEYGTGYAYFYHNTVVYDNRRVGTTFINGSGKESNGNFGFASGEGSGTDSINWIALNNIILVDGRIATDPNTEPVSDYNLLYNLMTGGVWTKWDNVQYSSYTAWKSASGQEAHGLNALPIFVDKEAKDFRLAAGSPGIDAGVLIPGFNDPDSQWPFQGTAPDMGAYEGDALPPPPPPTHNVTIAVAVGGTTAPAAGTHPMPEGELVVTAIADTSYTFDHWEVNGGPVTGNPLRYQVTDDTTVQAVFVYTPPPPQQVSLSITAMPGGTTDPAPGTYNVTEGNTITVRAIPDSRHRFDHWEGDITSTAAQVDIQMVSDAGIVAVFSLPTPTPSGFNVGMGIEIIGIVVGLVALLRRR